MSWETYYQAYRNYITAASQTRLLTLASSEAFADFPNKLPIDVQNTWKQVINLLREIAVFITEHVEEGKTEFESHLQLDRPVQAILDDPLYSVVLSLAVSSGKSLSLRGSEFEMLLCQQELAMAIAQIEAFLSDTLRAICRVRPEVLRRNSQIDWKTIMACGSWDRLIDYMVEQFAYERGWKTLRERIDLLQRELNIPLQLCSEDLEFLGEAENYRHLVLHNGGRVSQEFINRTQRSDLSIGQFAPISPQYVEDLYYTSRSVVSDIFMATAKKFFGKQESELMGVWRKSQEDWE